MPLNMNTIGMGNSSGSSGEFGGSGGFSDTSYTESLISDSRGFDMDSISVSGPQSTYTGTFKYSRSGGDNILYPNYPSNFFEYNGEIYGVGCKDTNMPYIHKATITWKTNSESNGHVEFTQVATVGGGGAMGTINTFEVIGEYVYFIGEDVQAYDNLHARLYRWDGTSVTDIFNKDILDLKDKRGNGFNYYETDSASTRDYQICPVLPDGASQCKSIILIGKYYDGSNSNNPQNSWWIKINLGETFEIETIVKAATDSSLFPTRRDTGFNIFTESGKMLVAYYFTSYSFDQYEYKINIDEELSNDSVTLTNLNKSVWSGKRNMFYSSLSAPLNNNYACVMYNESDGYGASQVAYLVNWKNNDFEVKQISIATDWLTNYYLDDVWSGPWGFITFKYETPCMIVSFNESTSGSSRAHYINVGGAKVTSDYTIEKNDGKFILTSYFEKGDILYSDDGIYEYILNDETVSLGSDKNEFEISESGTYEIHSHTNSVNPLENPALTVLTVHGTLEHLKYNRVNETTVEATLTTNLTVNDEAVEPGGKATYTSDTGRFVIKVKE